MTNRDKILQVIEGLLLLAFPTSMCFVMQNESLSRNNKVELMFWIAVLLTIIYQIIPKK